MLTTTSLRFFSCCGLVLVVPSLVGCHSEGELQPAAYVETTYGPAHYPTYDYEGQTVYLIGGYWYYREPGGRWMVYEEEPPVLARHRLSIQQAPPAPVRPATPPPVRFGTSPPRSAPPADLRHDDPRRVPPPAPKKEKRRFDDRDDRDDRDAPDHGDRRLDEGESERPNPDLY